MSCFLRKKFIWGNWISLGHFLLFDWAWLKLSQATVTIGSLVRTWSFMINTGSLNSQGMISQGSSYFSEKFISPMFFCSVLSWRKFVLMYKHRFGYTFFECLLLMLLNFTNSIRIIQLLFLVLNASCFSLRRYFAMPVWWYIS